MEFKLPGNLWPVVAAAAGTAWPPAGDDERGRFVRQAGLEGVLPILFDAPPADVDLAAEHARWRAFELANRQRSATLGATIARLPELIGAEFILLKGSDVAYRLYPRPELRPMSDIDILVRLEDMRAIEDRLAARGFFPRYSRLTHFAAMNPDRAFRVADVTVEVHHSIVHRSSARIDYGAVWSSKVRSRAAGIDAYRLSDADALLTTAATIAKDNLATPLIRYLDLWLMIRDNPRLAEAALERAHGWRMENALHVVLRIAGSLFPELRIAQRRRPWLDAAVVPAVSHARNIDRMSRPTRLWRKYWLLDSVPIRWSYFARIAAAAAQGFMRRSELQP